MSREAPAPRPRAATLRDVAAAAGVSIWTASNAYGNPSRVAPATRERVLAAAHALGYPGPHPGARSLASGRSRMVALVAPGEAEALLGDPAAALVARGLLTACDRAGYSLVLSGRLEGEMVDARVVFRGPAGPDGRVPTVVVDGPAGGGVRAVGADVRGAAAAVARHLSDLGHRRLAVLAWPGADERLAGVEDGWRGPRPLTVYRLDAGPGDAVHRAAPAAGEALARAALSARPRPTAVLGLSDALALSALGAAHWMGLDVPGDVSVAGLDDLPGSDAAGLTTSMVPYRPLGERAGDLVTALLAGQEPEPAPELPTALSIRGSTGAPPDGG